MRRLPSWPELACGLAAWLLCVATLGGSLRSVDEVAVYGLAYNLAQRGAVDVDVLWLTASGMREPPSTGVGGIGPDGHFYSGKGALTSLLAIPLVRLALAVPGGDPVITALLLNSVLTALTAALVARHLRLGGSHPSVALLAGLVYASATMALPYAKRLFTEPTAALCVLLAYHWLAPHRRPLTFRRCLAAGAAFGGAIAASYSNAVLAPCFVVLLVASPASRGWRERAGRLAAFGAGAGVWVAALAAYNLARFGDPTRTGLSLWEWSAPYFSPAAALVRAYALLLSPYRGLLWYNPVLWLAPLALVLALRPRDRGSLAALGMAAGGTACFVAFFSAWSMWWGGFNWGPRFLLPILPLWAIGLAPVFAWLLDRARAIGRAQPTRLGVVGLAAARLGAAAIVLASAGVALTGALSDTFATESAISDRGLLHAIIQPESLSASPLLTDAAYFQAVDGIRRLAGGEVDTWWGGRVKAARPDAASPAPASSGRAAAQTAVTEYAALRRAVSDVAERAAPGDAVMLMAPGRLETFLHAYRLPNWLVGVAADQLGAQPELEGGAMLADRLLSAPRVWLVTDAGQADAGNVTERWLEASAYRARNEFYAPWRVAAFGTSQASVARQPLEAVFGQRLRLVEVAYSTSAKPGGAVTLAVVWRRLSPQDALEGVAWYAHLIGPDGALVAQHDALVGGGYGWPGGAEDAPLVDRRGILVPAGAAPGEYRVRIGVYSPDGPLAAQGAAQVIVRVGQ